MSTTSTPNTTPPPGSWPTDRQGRREAGLCGVDCFKDRFCGYRGEETWCDRTRARCTALGNAENFDSEVPKWPDWGVWWEWAFLALAALGIASTWLWVENRTLATICYSASIMVGLPFCRQEGIMRVCQLWLAIRHSDRPTLRVQGLPGKTSDYDSDNELPT